VLSWTIADLTGPDVPGRDDLTIALAMLRGEQPGSVKRGDFPPNAGV
jgi:magnesium chelatase family protein